MKKNEDKLIHKIGRGVVTGVMTTSLVLTGTPALLAATQTVALADEGEKESEPATQAIAKIGDETFSSLQKAFEKAAETPDKQVEIDLVGDAKGPGVFVGSTNPADFPNCEKVNVVLDLQGHTYTTDGPLIGSKGSELQGFHFEKDSTVTIKNGTIEASDNKTDMLLQNYSNLTLTDVTLDISNIKDARYAISINNGKTTLNGSTSIKANADQYAYDVCWWPTGYPDGAQVTVDTTGTISGKVQLDLWKPNTEATPKSNLTIKNGTFDETWDVDNTVFPSDANGNNPYVNITGGTFKSDVVKDGYTDPNASAIAVKSGDTTTYAVGQDSINAAASNAKDGDTITVTKASQGLALPSTAATVSNATDATVTVGNTPIKNGETTETVAGAKTGLQKAADDSQAIFDQIDQRKFSADSVKAFKDAIAKANEVAKSDSTGTDDVTKAQEDLTTAYKNLKGAPGVSMYRLYNPNSGEHFYTGSKAEHDHLVDVGWSDEGTGWVAPASSNTPVYRLYNPNAGDHHYTTDASERDTLIEAGWNYEGIGWFSDDAREVPLYRQYNPNAQAGSHNFTTSQDENDHLVSLGWRAEGIGWYGIKADAAK